MESIDEKVMKVVGIDFDGWFVDSADGLISAFKHEDDVDKTLKFFGKFVGTSDMTTKTHTAICPDCGSEDVQMEQRAWAIRRFEFRDGELWVDDDRHVSEDDGPPVCVCLECGYESDEAENFRPGS